jgi:hypothetical protein
MPMTSYANRRPNAVVINYTIDQAAAELIEKHCSGNRHQKGAFVARLVYEFDARYEERQRLREVLKEVPAEGP